MFYSKNEGLTAQPEFHRQDRRVRATIQAHRRYTMRLKLLENFRVLPQNHFNYSQTRFAPKWHSLHTMSKQPTAETDQIPTGEK